MERIKEEVIIFELVNGREVTVAKDKKYSLEDIHGQFNRYMTQLREHKFIELENGNQRIYINTSHVVSMRIGQMRFNLSSI